MFKPPCQQTMLKHALAAAKAASRRAYETTYVGGIRTVKRQPDANTRYFTGLHSWDFARQAQVTLATARRRLMALADAGLIVNERPYRYRVGAVLRFFLLDEDADRIGRELIEELRAEGLPWDDEWLAEQKAERANGSNAA